MSQKIKEKPNKKEFADSKKINNSIFTHTAILLISAIIILGALDIWCYSSLIDASKWFLIIISIATGLFMGLGLVFFFTKRVGWLKADFVIIAIAALFTWGYYLIEVLDLLTYLTNAERLQAALESVGWWKYLVYCLLQFLQVTFIPLPAMATTIVGTLLFGPLVSSLLSLVGILLGSMFAFWLGDKFGEKVVSWIVGEKSMKKYSSLLFDKGKYMFFLMMLFPLFPDDVLCLVAGMTAMSFRFFFITMILTRPIGIFMTCYLGSGEIIPFSGWGLIVWAVLIVIMILLFWASYRYKDKIELLINKLNSRLKKLFMSKTDKLFLQLGINKEIKLLPEHSLTYELENKKVKKTRNSKKNTIKKMQ